VNEDVVFHAYLRQKCIELRQSDHPKLINGPFYTYRPIQSFHQRKSFVFVIICDPGGLHVAAIPSGLAPTCQQCVILFRATISSINT